MLVSFRFILIASIVFLSGCAQVGYITGGDKDQSAPKPNLEKMNPRQEAVNFKGNEIIIPFDEFIKLNNPIQNIKIVPPHAKIDASIKGKTLYLKWEENLQDNTTYSIFMNGAVKDITEGNDSTMQVVFSTGSVIDSLSYQVNIIDAYSNKAQKGVYVAFYDKSTNDLISIAETNQNGLAKLSYIKPGDYKMIAFEDLNLNLQYDSIEPVAFRGQNLPYFENSVIDTMPLRLFTPKEKAKLRTKKFIGPGTLAIGIAGCEETSSYSVDGIDLSANNIRNVSNDSSIVYLPLIDDSKFTLVTSNECFTDTSTIRVNPFEKNKKVDLICGNFERKVLPGDTLLFYSNAQITEVDTSRIKILNLKDSSVINLNPIWDKYSVRFGVSSYQGQEISIMFDTASVSTIYGTNKSYICQPEILKARDLGIINMTIENQPASIILNVLHGGKVVRTIIKNDSSSIQISNLLPGEYTFQIISDDNQNGKWDTGDYSQNKQPEKVYYFTKSIKVRANWEIEVPLHID